MWDLVSFLEGFALDAVVLTVVMGVLGPVLLERWMRNNLADMLHEFITSPAFGDIRAVLIQQFKGAIFGGRPPSIKGLLKKGLNAGGELALEKGLTWLANNMEQTGDVTQTSIPPT